MQGKIHNYKFQVMKSKTKQKKKDNRTENILKSNSEINGSKVQI